MKRLLEALWISTQWVGGAALLFAALIGGLHMVGFASKTWGPVSAFILAIILIWLLFAAIAWLVIGETRGAGNERSDYF